ncbi:MAG: signal peptide peptidase SppA [Planctomycetota bacterium]|nr:MAG: signal peptide peptidase SppA [Planctomycetota bacterium]
MKRFLLRLLAAVGLASLIFFGALLIWWPRPSTHVPDSIYLEMDLQSLLWESQPPSGVAQWIFGEVTTVRDVVDCLDRGAEDPRVRGLLLKVGNGIGGMAKAQEIRNAIHRFRQQGKKTIAFCQTFGEFSSSNLPYYVAAACEEIHLQPGGELNLLGFMAESRFLTGGLQKIGVTARVDRRKEFKTAPNAYTETHYTKDHRTATEGWLFSLQDQWLNDLAKDRKLELAQLQALIADAPYRGEKALETGLTDRLAFEDQSRESMKNDLGSKVEPMDWNLYLQRAGRIHQQGATIALIFGNGPILRGHGGIDPTSLSPILGADAVAATFEQAIQDSDVRAIILRLESPGGSVVASQTLWRLVVRARQKGKPVIVSMGDVAASGGYWVAMAAEKIVAQPGTLTGSIGVFGGKPLTEQAWGKLGITWDRVEASPRAGMWSLNRDFHEGEWQRLQAWLDQIYEDFVTKVAAARKLDRESVEALAKGRVWTGEQALELGLVDALGGFPVAVELAREAAGIPAEQALRLQVFPEPSGFLHRLLRAALAEEAKPTGLQGWWQEWQPALETIEAIHRPAYRQVLRWPDWPWDG